MRYSSRREKRAKVVLACLLTASIAGLLFLPDRQLRFVSAIFGVFFASALMRRESMQIPDDWA